MKKLAQWLFLWVVLIAAGCGGGSDGGGANGDVGVFITDDLNTNFSGVWVTLLKVELEKQGGGFVTVFDDPNGKVLNLRALNDGNPRYAFLGKDRIPEGTYIGMRFTLDKDVRINSSGGGSAQARVFDDPFINPSNPEQAILTLTFAAPRTVTGTSNDIVADFVLSSWTENGVKIQNAILSEGTGTGLNDNSRHDEDKFKGTISSLSGTAPDFTFTLNLHSSNSVTVTTNSLTAIFNNNGAPNPQLANSKRVEVRGTFDVATRTVVATSIKIKGAGDDDEEDEAEANGIAVEVDLPTGTFDVELGEAEGFLPVQPFVHVVTNSATLFFSHGGTILTQAQFFSIIAAGNVRVEVEGTWSIATNAITAFKAKIEDDGDDDHEAEARGTANTINALDGTFRIALTQWEGFSGAVGMQINVETSASTEFRDINGEEVTQAEFFVLLATAASVEAEGAFNNGTILADEVRIRGAIGGGGQAEAFGSVSNINSGSQTFDLTVLEWIGFSISAGQTIQVVMAAGATFRDSNGLKISATDFFNELQAGMAVEVEGSFNAGNTTLTATKAKIED